VSDNSIEARRAVWRARAKTSYKRSGGKYQKAHHKRTYKAHPKLNPCLSYKNAKELINNYKLHIGRCGLHEFYNNGQQYYCDADNLVAFCFDHIDRTTKLATISQMIGRATHEQIVTEINKCWLVCANCHALKGYENKDHLPIKKIEHERSLLTLFDI
jgi:hypothetical protein